MLVTIFVGSFFVAQAAAATAIIAAYGRRAFFVDGLRITDWKHDILSNGAHLSFVGKLIDVPTFLLLMALLIYGTDFAAMVIRALISRSAPWVGGLLRLVGGAGLWLFTCWYYRQGHTLVHPIPVAALLGGAVLIWRAIASTIGGVPPQQQA